MVLKPMRHGFIVTTAHHFSAEAKSSADRAITLDMVDTFELVDIRRFLDMLELVQLEPVDLWRQHLPSSHASGSQY